MNFAKLTDSPAGRESRDGATGYFRTWHLHPNRTTQEFDLARRIFCRDYGNATPAQALFLLSEFPTLTQKAALQTNLLADTQRLPEWTHEDHAHVKAHWANQGSVKEHNALIRLFRGTLTGKDKVRFFCLVNWMVTAQQDALQAVLAPLVVKRTVSESQGRMTLKGKNGLKGYLLRSEMLPRSVSVQVVDPCHDLIGEMFMKGGK